MDQLEQILRLKLINHRARPTFSYMRNHIEVVTMFDSGASIPVWCSGEKILLKAYPEARKSERKGSVSGFGKEKEDCLIYILPIFELSDGIVTYRIRNLHIAVCKKPEIGCSLILSDTMFSKTDTLIRRRREKAIEIYFDKTEYICTPKYFSNTSSFSISVWSQ